MPARKGRTTRPAVLTRRLTKHYGETKALDGIDLRIERGSVYGLLGPNGAGKTTAIRVLATLAKPTGGQAKVLGFDVVKDPKAVRQKISLTGQFASVDEELSGIENLVLVARLLGMRRGAAKKRARELLAAFELSDAGKRQVSTYSGGMRRRLDIAASLVVTPEILFLDEPTTGLDPKARNHVWQIVRGIAATGTTVVLTTQYLEEADRLADRMAVIDQGRIIAEGTSQDLKRLVGANALHLRVRYKTHRARAIQVLSAALGTEVAKGEDVDDIVASVERARVVRALAALESAGIPVAEYAVGMPSLDEVFFTLTGKPAEAD